MPRSIEEICTRLKWYSRLCKKYLNTEVVEKPDRYIIRYMVIGMRNLILSNCVIYATVDSVCSSIALRYLEELGLQFLYAKYSYADDSLVVSFLKMFCPCLNKVIDLRC